MKAVQRLRPDIVEERAAFAAWQQTVDGARIVCVDESGIVAGGRVAYGYAPRGERCEEHAPYRRGRRTNLMGWLGLGRGKVVAVEGRVDGALFHPTEVGWSASSVSTSRRRWYPATWSCGTTTASTAVLRSGA